MDNMLDNDDVLILCPVAQLGKVTIHVLGSRNYLGFLELALSLDSRGYWAPEFNWLHRIPSLLGSLGSLCYVWL